MRKSWVIGFAAAVLALFAGVAVVRAEAWKEVDAKEVKAMMDAKDAFVINPLSKIEFNDLAIKGSINIPLDELESKLPKDKNAKLVFYCLGPK